MAVKNINAQGGDLPANTRLYLTGDPINGVRDFNHGIKANNIVHLDNKEKISFWLDEIIVYNRNDILNPNFNIPNVRSNEVVAIKPKQEQVWFNIMGENLKRTLQINTSVTSNTQYVVYRFNSNVKSKNYGYLVKHRNNQQLYFASTFGLQLTVIDGETPNANIGYNYAYVFMHNGIPSVQILTDKVGNSFRVKQIRSKYQNDTGTVGFYTDRLCMSDLKGKFWFTGALKPHPDDQSTWNNYYGALCLVPSGSF